MGRVGVDLYPEQIGVPLAEVRTFAKSLGGSATNVAVAAARLGRRAAVITKVGRDGFGDYVRVALAGFGVDARWVGTDPDLRTPIVFCEIYPPDRFPILFYREPKAPDMNITRDELDLEAIGRAPVFWTTGTGLSDEPSRTATLAALDARAGREVTIHDLDHRSHLWRSSEDARRYAREALRRATVVVGNSDEVGMATGGRDADARRDRVAAGGPGGHVTRLTMAQALVRFLASQHVERDGVEQRFFAGCWGIFGHGNVAGIGEAMFERPELLPYHMARNEQSMVHSAVGYARMKDRLQTFACTSSIGPGATNMISGAALATVNRLPVLLLPGDVFASRIPDPVLQQLEVPERRDLSVNDAFQAVSRYWDRVTRPEQIIPAALAAMRVLARPAATGAVTLALPQDVQAGAYDYPDEFLANRVWRIERRPAERAALDRAVAALRAAKRPLIVAGGGVIYSCASQALRAFVDATGIPVADTQAGKGSLPYDHPSALGAVGATGTAAANRVARDADLVIGIGTRWSDFTTASKSIFQNKAVQFVNINVAEFDAQKHGGIAVT